MAATVMLVMKKPRTAREVSALLGCRFESARRNFQTLEAEGLVTRGVRQKQKGAGGHDSSEWTWTQEAE